MEAWAKDGYEYHRDHKLGDCLFCGQELTEERLRILAAHFSEEINQISREAATLRDTFARAREAIQAVYKENPSPEQLAPGQRAGFEKLAERLGPITGRLDTLLEGFMGLLARKLREPATALVGETEGERMREWAETYDGSASVLAEQIKIIEDHNRFVDHFDQEREQARERIASHLLASNHATLVEYTSASSNADLAVERIERQVVANHKEIENKEAALREHAAAAPELNREIELFLRHTDITVHAVDEGYQLRRSDGTLVNRLSEGEKTAITFCHFITSIESENRKLKDTIVVVDDPISSLDTRALSYMASLIRERLAEARQLFVFTHNVPFMTECANGCTRAP